MRYERKFRIENLGFESVRQVLEIHPAGFNTHFPDRQVNSIYFDDCNFELAQSTLAGVSDRCKYRIRWYGKNIAVIEEPVLEKKIKQNQLGYKDSIQLAPLDFKENFRKYCDQNIFKDLALFPSVAISYKRTYLLSFDQKVRVTIDRSIEYRAIENYKVSTAKIEETALVVEFKYEEEHQDEANDMMASLPFRLGKNSKYVNALFMLNV